jgi:hypothetical protein
MFALTKTSFALCLPLTGLVLVLACSRQEKTRPTPRALPSRGDWLIVEQTAAVFFKGRVLSVSGSQLKIQRASDGNVVDVVQSDTYRLPVQPSRVTEEAYAVCELGTDRWESCRVIRAAENGWLVADTAGREHRISSLQLLEPTSLTTMNIRHRFEAAARRRAFDAAVAAAGLPRRPLGWSVSPERLVLAERDGTWLGAKVVEVDDERIVVRLDGQGETSELPVRSIAPQPPTCGAAARGERALRRPYGHGAPWEPVLVVAVDGLEATVENIERTRTSVQLSDLCPLGEARAPASP